MISINFFENKLFFTDYRSNKIELGSYTFLQNKSKMPLYHLKEDSLLITLSENYSNFCKSVCSIYKSVVPESDKFALLYTLYMIIFSFGIKICTPIKAATIGCNSEIIHTVAYIIKSLRKNSSLTVINDEINIDGSNDFLTPVTTIDDIDFSALICDYDRTNLKDENYNMTVIFSNGSYEDFEGMIKESNRILKDDGKLIFVVDNNPEFEMKIKSLGAEFKEYAVSDSKKIIISDKINYEDTTAYLNFDLEKLTKHDIKELIRKLNNDIGNAVKIGDTCKKIKLIDLKENLICYMLYEDDRDFYANKICEFKENMKK